MHGVRSLGLHASGFAVLFVSIGGCGNGATAPDRQSNGASLYPPLSYDGRYVAFYSVASNLVPGDTNETGDIFVHDRQTETTTRISVSSQGREGNFESTWPSLSGDGRYVAFSSSATNFAPNDTNQKPDVFVHEQHTGITTRVSIGVTGEESNGVSYTYFPSISAEGRYIAFASNASNLVQGDANETWDIFVHDRETSTTTLISVNSEAQQGNAPSLHAVISGDGRYLAFHSYASNLVADDTNNVEDVFVHDRETGITTRVSVDSEGREGNNSSDRAAISHDGSVVAFSSVANNLVLGDTNNAEDVFVHDFDTGITSQVSMSADDVGDAICCVLSTICCVIVITDRKSVISADGLNIVYRSDLDESVPDDTNFYQDIFVYDRIADKTSRVSIDSQGGEANRESVHHGVSFDGRIVAFSSEASNLVADDTNGVSDIFVHDRETGITTRISVSSASSFLK